jgi:predicted DNA-binding transcriptional regulator YafY
MRADRLLSILLLLQSRRRATARELARHLEVSERTILRDMDALSGSGIPVIAERGKGGGWALLDDYQTKLTGLSTAEIRSLFLSRPSRVMADLGLKRESEAALMKLQASLPAGVREEAGLARRRILIDSRGWRDPAESIPSLPVLLDAVWRGKQVRFLYACHGHEPGERIVHPLGLVAKGSTWYLVAHVEGETRTYRVSRIQEASALDRSAVWPSNFDLQSHWESSIAEFREKLPRYYATFLAKSSVMRWARYRGWRLEEEVPQGDRIRIKLRFDIEEEAVQFGLSFGGDLEVIEPADLREKVFAGARAIVMESNEFRKRASGR